MSINQRQNVSYGLSQALIPGAPAPIVSKRSPGVHDFAAPGTIWTNILTNQVYILASIVANTATWVLIAAAGGAGVFSSLTVTPGPISLTGTTSINTAGAATTSIGVGGTGAVSIGNATGTTIPAGSLTVTAGNVVLTLGDLQLNVNRVITWSNGISILTGTGDPNGIVLGVQGSLYLRTDGDDVDNRAFINTDGISTWAGITTNL